LSDVSKTDSGTSKGYEETTTKHTNITLITNGENGEQVIHKTTSYTDENGANTNYRFDTIKNFERAAILMSARQNPSSLRSQPRTKKDS
jgi:hypothetical protein